jgi:hypothetical protein
VNFFINDEGKKRRYPIYCFENQFATALVSFITNEPAGGNYSGD